MARKRESAITITQGLFSNARPAPAPIPLAASGPSNSPVKPVKPKQPKTKRGRVQKTAYLSVDTADKLSREAFARGMEQSELVELALIAYLKN